MLPWAVIISPCLLSVLILSCKVQNVVSTSYWTLDCIFCKLNKSLFWKSNKSNCKKLDHWLSQFKIKQIFELKIMSFIPSIEHSKRLWEQISLCNVYTWNLNKIVQQLLQHLLVLWKNFRVAKNKQKMTHFCSHEKWNQWLPTFGTGIVYVWSQYDGPNIEQWTIGYGWRQHQEAKLKIVGEVNPWSNQQKLTWSLVLIYNTGTRSAPFAIIKRSSKNQVYQQIDIKKLNFAQNLRNSS